MSQPTHHYLDYAAAAPLRPEALAALTDARGQSGNTGSQHGAGIAAKRRWDAALDTLARLLGCQADELVITSGATESCNLAILGSMLPELDAGNPIRILTSAAEHPACSSAVDLLEARGATVDRLAVNPHGQVALADVETALCPKTRLVTFIAAHNETGAVQRIHRIIEAVRSAERRFGTTILVHLDAAQWVAWQRLDVHHLGADFVSASGAKFGGPHAGILYVKRGTKLTPLIVGGGQQQGRRSGTVDVAAAAGLAAALTAAWDELPSAAPAVRTARDMLADTLLAAFPDAVGRDRPDGLPNFIHLTVPGLDADNAVAALSAAGIDLSTGSACSAADAAKQQRIHAALGIAGTDTRSTLRITLGPDADAAAMARLAPTIVGILNRVRQQSRATAALQAAAAGLTNTEGHR